ncbi:3-hydroxyacyl-CoA dehydrogenase family protein [Halalkalibacter nanhaiisediminis]|uniref:3-hydroxybutyryl-CoA dehydrogenase n=1 Tax=Halalkalibacter nanhaiisediminis TaxID=688079 RepID=A0A562QB94_9BACI|nr:3-hydroxyacyl-CoA dehydrogenase NAD-binding domain-containing protein [Halalkalibacter nanhaiisediminis]TWI53983.1 3-hydroxybutyryl-CoA dehydrogenase [Halalkalibacter nanhaiisediminis]
MSQLSLKQCNEVLVIGCGLMGAGIAQVVAQAGFNVIVMDRTEEDLIKGKNQIEKALRKQDATAQEEIKKRIIFSTRISDGKNADLAIEAIPEKIDQKKELFVTLDELLKPEAILASNTSSLSIADMSSVTKRPEQVIGLHFFSPVPIMQLLEIVVSINTSKVVIEWAQAFGEKLRKKTIIAKDYPGFVVNRVLVPMLNEAAFLVMEGNAPSEIDKGLMLGANHPIGPLKLTDMVGVDVVLYTLQSLYEGYNDSKYRPCPLLKRMVEAGHLGKKTGRGFYEYK